MRYFHFDTLEIQSYKDDVWQLLCQYDDTFIPPLSSRQSTSQADLLSQETAPNKLYAYFENILTQSIFLAIDDNDKVVGFMSYKPSYISDDLQDQIDTVYITTIIVHEECRGQGITSTFYSMIETIAKEKGKPLMTRTWSTNDAHIRVLNKIGMVEIKRLVNARGFGIDTVYYRKHIGG